VKAQLFFSTRWPDFCQPWIPAGMMNTFE